MEQAGQADGSVWRFEAPVDRAALRMKAGFAWTAGGVLCIATGQAILTGSVVGTIVGLCAAATFAAAGFASWRHARMDGSPLLLDERGITLDDGMGTRSFLAWEDVDEVGLRGSFARRVVLVRREGDPEEVEVPRTAHAGAPPEWMAGLIETFRHRALHRG